MSKTPRNISDLAPAPYNPRDIDPAALEGLQSSLERFGDLSGLTWNKRTGHLVAGHQRLKALQDAHGDQLVIKRRAVVAPDGQKYPIRVVDLPEAEEMAANLAANNPWVRPLRRCRWSHAHLQGEFTGDVSLVVDSVKLELPEAVGLLRLDELAPEVSPHESPAGAAGESTTSDTGAADALADQIRQTDEFLEATNTVARMVVRIEAALTRRAEAEPEKLNAALLVVVPNGKGGETMVLADPDQAEAAAELRRYYEAGESPIEELFCRVLAMDPPEKISNSTGRAKS